MLETEAAHGQLRGWRLLGAALAVAVVAAVLAAVAATPASATVVSKCSGTRIDSKSFSWDGIANAGRIELYYDNGYNCAMTRDNLSGKAKMGATLYVCRDNSLSWCNDPMAFPTIEDTPNLWWYDYSDGAKLWAAGRCVAFSGDYDRDGGAAVHPYHGYGHCS